VNQITRMAGRLSSLRWQPGDAAMSTSGVLLLTVGSATG
jgi:hypothetical protein